MCRAGAYLGPGPGLCRRLGRRRLGRCCPGCSLGCRLLGWLPFPLRWGRRVRGLRSHRLACDTGAGKQPDPCVARVIPCWPCAHRNPTASAPSGTAARRAWARALAGLSSTGVRPSGCPRCRASSRLCPACLVDRSSSRSSPAPARTANTVSDGGRPETIDGCGSAHLGHLGVGKNRQLEQRDVECRTRALVPPNASAQVRRGHHITLAAGLRSVPSCICLAAAAEQRPRRPRRPRHRTLSSSSSS